MEHLNYGAVGNCRTAALISDKGSIDWFCFPDFDSPSVFGKLLDEKKGGNMSFIVGNDYRISQRYLEHTNILSTLFEATEGAFEVIDFMPRYKLLDYDYYLPPELYRLIRLKRGTPRFRVNYNPALNYARGEVGHKTGPEYVKTYAKANERDTIYLYSGIPYDVIFNQQEVLLQRDEFLLVSYNQKLIPIDMNRVNLEFQRTRLYWMNWTNRSKKYTAFNEQIERSMLVLKLMSYQRSGAVLAALTTSLPESIGEVRNWDYRFCWLRDASMSIETLVKVGHRGAAERFIAFITGILHSKYDRFQIMYGIRGERVLTEYDLPHLAGYKNSKPVRVGNDAYHQMQNDSFGYLMDVIYQYYLYFPGTLDEIEDMFEVVKNIVRTVMEDWRKPDKGIWEIRGDEKHFVLSKVMCWVALDRAEKIAVMLQKGGYADKWRCEAELIKTDVFMQGWKEEIQSFSQTYCNTELDSSLLLMEVYGFIDATDPRYKQTVDAIYRKLMYKGLMFRYNNVDDFGIPSSAFTICTFWMVRALYVTGRQAEALTLFETLLSYSNHLGLFSEDLDFDTKSQLGNFPQAYSHLALINTAMLFGEEKRLSKFIRP
ncbi:MULTISPECIES: glycoside hydrolase family 15 protein [Macellibacteroides]|uniref:Glucoamylase (Glucan-1,4-alpha-glucosidase), GH15 family n=1 Tax=Parabacteroides chartae TaxID=1037355 RepID=A0A1T5E8S0_9BACT|nr:glycoside hydrolase family 15 protein [Parabacteroides chartae]SKB80189.1 Glucoamylase (glucan-1,4-alpha-glucosidase), GH15 family [Parabacteroides chartae]